MQYEMFLWTSTKTSESKEEHIGDSRKESKWNVDEQEKMSDVWPHASLKAQMVTPKGSCPGDNERVMERSPFM